MTPTVAHESPDQPSIRYDPHMSRPRTPNRFADLIDAALTVFAKRGLEKTRMSDIAKELGVSAGTLYNYVESKDALFLLLLEYGLDDAPPQEPDHYPVQPPSKDQLWKRLPGRLQTYTRQPRLEDALTKDHPDDARAELRAILAELYEIGMSRRRWINLLERSVADAPQVAQLFVVHVRRRIEDRLAALFERRMRHGHLRAVSDPRLASRYVLEVVTTFARRLPHQADAASFSDDASTMHEQVLDLLTATFTT